MEATSYEEESEVGRAVSATDVPPVWHQPAAAAGAYIEDAKGVDQLRGEERHVYEKTRVKVLLSLVFGSLSLLFLGFCAETGGKSSAFKQALNRINSKGALPQIALLPKGFWQYEFLGTTKYELLDSAMLTLLFGGVGFAAFCHFCAFVLAVAAAVLMSPFMTGTVKEMSILRGPVDFSKEVAARRRSTSRGGGFSGVGLT